MSTRDEQVNQQLTAMGTEKALLLRTLDQMHPHGPVRETRTGLEEREFSSRQKRERTKIRARIVAIDNAQNALLKVRG